MIKELTKLKISLWLPVFIWAGVIFLFSSFPTTTTTTFYLGDFLLKKSAHVIEYGIFFFFVYRALINSNVTKSRSMWLSVLIAFMYGLSDEFHQSFTPGRGPKFTDVLIDTFGAILFIYGIVNNIKKMPKVVKDFMNKISIKN
mgnify:CR=1 FL=1